MDDATKCFFIGAVVGVISTTTGIAIAFDEIISDGRISQEFIQECEKTLPRNKHCDIIAVEKGVINNE